MKGKQIGEQILVKNKLIESEILEQKGKLSQAIETLEALLPKCLAYPEIHFHLASLYATDLNTEKAFEHFRRAQSLAPKDARIKLNLATLLKFRGEYKDAIACFEFALKNQLQPEHCVIELTRLYAKTGELKKALHFLSEQQSYLNTYIDLKVLQLEILALDRDYKTMHAVAKNAVDSLLFQLGSLHNSRQTPTFNLFGFYIVSLIKLGDKQEANKQLELLLDLTKDYESAMASVALRLLDLQEFEEGVYMYSKRFPEEKKELYFKNQALKIFESDLSNKRVKLFAEQGLGDQLYFLRYLPLLQQRGAQVIVAVDKKIKPLIENAFSQAQVILRKEERDYRADYTCLPGDLPFHLQHYGPPPPPYPLVAKEEWKEKISQILKSAGPPPYIGITWKAGIMMDSAPNQKHFPLKMLVRLFKNFKGTLVIQQRFFDQKEKEQIEKNYSGRYVDLSALSDNIPACLALMQALDDYVTVSNTNVYLRHDKARKTRLIKINYNDWKIQKGDLGQSYFPGSTCYCLQPFYDYMEVFCQIQKDLLKQWPQAFS